MSGPCDDQGLLEYGFWDYTTPAAGGMEAFRRDDYLLLLDDMAEAGMNSLAINVKWHSTGYRSHLPYLDQVSDNPAIASDNELLSEVIVEANRLNIKICMQAFVTGYPVEETRCEPVAVRMDRDLDQKVAPATGEGAQE